MIKKTVICVSLCIILCGMVGCTKHITSSLPTADASTSLSTQLTNRSSTNLSTPTQSTGDLPEPLPTQSTVSEVTTSSTLTRSEKTNLGADNVKDTYKLIVKGKEITITNQSKLNYEHHYAELPLIAIMKELGAKVEWQGKTTAKITFDGKDYFLDTAKGSLVEKGSTFNMLVVAPGSKHGVFYRTVGNEFIIDSDSAKMLLVNKLGVKISVDYNDRIVNIS